MEYYTDLVYKQPNERAWVTYIKGKVTEENNSFSSMVVGKTGSGKSYGVLRLCQEIDPDFQLDGNWFFRAEEFMKAFTTYYKDRQHSSRGKLWILDEAGVDLNSLKYQNSVNKAYSSLFQTSRFRNYIFFGTVPFLDFISKQVRKLMHHRMDAKGVERNKGVFIPRCLEWSEKKDDFYNKMLICEYPNGDRKKINRMMLPLARKDLLREYEKRRADFSDDVNEELVKDSEIKTTTKEATQREKDVLELLKKCYKKMDIAQELNISNQRLSEILRHLRLKGYDINHNREGVRIYNPEIKKWEFYPKETKNLNT